MIAPKVLNLNDMILDTDWMLRRLIGADVELVTIPGDSLDAVRADPAQMEQVLLNLVVNARDATPAGGTIAVETRNVTLDQPRAWRRW